MKINKLILTSLNLTSLVVLTGTILASSIVSADDNSTVDQINITVPMSCTMTGAGMDSHSTEIQNGLYKDNIGTTTLHAFCNDNEGFAIYAAGYTGNEIGGESSNKLVGTTASSNATIVSGIATTAGSPDISNWAMKLAISQDSGDTTSTNAFTIDSAPNVDLPSEAEQSTTPASFSEYHVVPNEYVKVAHKNSMTDMTATTGGVKLTTTYAAYISKTQSADTYNGQVKYTLVHPSSAAPVLPGTVAVNYNGNGKTFAGGGNVNKVVYATSPMYIATTPQIVKSSNVNSDGMQNGAYTNNETVLTPVTSIGASKMKVEIQYGISSGTLVGVTQGEWNGDFSALPEDYEAIMEQSSGNATFVFEGDTVTVGIMNRSGASPIEGYDYGLYARVYPIYTTEQEDTEPSDEFDSFTTDTGTYATTTDWYGSWYADINSTHYEFLDETEVKNFLENNIATLGGTTVDIYRSLSFDEAYAKANKTQAGGYYLQQDLDMSICQTVAMEQNSTVKDVRDNNTYMIGRLKDGNCWMLDNLALDPTDPTTAANMNASNTNATQEAINNLLNGGGTTTGWSSVAVENKITGWTSTSPNNDYEYPYVNNQSKDTLVTSYGPASTNGRAKVGIYYNYCAASASTYCYASGQGVDVPDTIIDAPQDICPANWRMPTGRTGEYHKLLQKYGSDATNDNSFQYNLSTPLSGGYGGSSAFDQGNYGNWWSSTYDNSNGMVYLLVDPTHVYPYNGYSRASGMSMRCLMAD